MDELDNYIQQSAATGKSYSLIYQELVNAGWNPGTVAARINTQTESLAKPSVNKISPMALFAIAIVTVALCVFIVVSIWAGTRN